MFQWSNVELTSNWFHISIAGLIDSETVHIGAHHLPNGSFGITANSGLPDNNVLHRPLTTPTISGLVRPMAGC